jgi:hypothetical protein
MKEGPMRLLFLLAAFLCCQTLALAGSEGVMGPHIEWDSKTLTLIHKGGHYARIIRLKNGELLCVYDFDRKLWVRHSADQGATWQTPVKVSEWTPGYLTNGELLALQDGTLLCFCNARPASAMSRRKHRSVGDKPGAENPSFEIQVSRSRDAGRSWESAKTIYRAGSEMENGCWEPAAIQLPSGEIQLFFANESPYRHSGEQEITLLRSRDGGLAWSAPEPVSFRAKHRDGMPVPLALQSGDGIAVAIEDNGLLGAFKPVIIFSSITDNWKSGPVSGTSRQRWGALQTPLASKVYAGAPYLRQMPTGETILSFQQSDSGDMKQSRMVVCVGDSKARNFAHAAYPFPQTAGASQLWNSLFVKNETTISAVSETMINGIRGIWCVDGRLVRQ